jgi:hypothetical protein
MFQATTRVDLLKPGHIERSESDLQRPTMLSNLINALRPPLAFH